MEKSTKLFNKNYFLLFQGQAVSRIGTQLYFMAMVLFIKDLTNSASLMGFLGMVAGIPAVILAPLGGTFADRHSRKRIIVLSDLVNGIIMLSFGIFLFKYSGMKTGIIIYLLLVMVISNVIGSFFTPAISAALPDIVPENKLRAANSLGQSSVQLSTILGWGLSGVVYVAIGAPLLVLLNGITFIFSAFSEMFIKIPQKIPEKAKTMGAQFRSFMSATMDGLRYVKRRAGLKKLLFASVFVNFFSVPITLLLPFYVDLVLHRSEVWFGYLIAAYAFGSIIGYFLASILKLSPLRRGQFIVLFMIMNAIIYVFLGLVQIVYLAMLMLMVTGLITGFVQVHISTILQLSTQTEVRGRVFGFLATLSGALTPIGMGLAGIVGDLTGKNIPLIYGCSGMIIFIISLYIMFNRDIRKFLAYDKRGNDPLTLETVHEKI